MSAYGRVNQRVLIMFYWVANSSEFSRGQMEILQIDPHCSAAISKCNVSLLIYCRLKTNFIAKSQLLHMGCPLTRERKQRKIQFSF